MKLKFYLRGIGLSMIITAIIVGLSYRNITPVLTDQEILDRAAEIEANKDNYLKEPTNDIVDEEDALNEEDIVDEDTSVDSDDTVVEDVVDSQSVEGEPAENLNLLEPQESEGEITSDTQVDDSEDMLEEESGETDITSYVMVEIVGGSSSDSVSLQLANRGLVDNATTFNQYLCDHGYDKKISVGVFQVPSGSSYEEVAKIITN